MYVDRRQRARERRGPRLLPGQAMAVDGVSSLVVVTLFPFVHTIPSNRRQGHRQLPLDQLEVIFKCVDFAWYLSSC